MAEYPLVLVVSILPAEPDTNWNTLPASLNVTVVDTCELSVKDTSPPELEIINVKEPGNKDSLYLFLSTEITQKSFEVIPP